MNNKKREIIEIDGKKEVSLEEDKYGIVLFIMRNGFQRTGVTVDDKDIDMIIKILNKYKAGCK